MKVEVTLLIPVADNGGTPFTPYEVGVFEGYLGEMFGDFSRLPATIVGRWVGDDGTEYVDILFAYLVGVDGLVKEGARLRKLVEFAKSHFRQEAIFLRYLGIFEIL